MKKNKLNESVATFNGDTKEAIQIIVDSITAKGQRKKLIENPKVKEILDRYHIIIEE